MNDKPNFSPAIRCEACDDVLAGYEAYEAHWEYHHPHGDDVMTDVEQTLAERGARYGDFTDHARYAQALQDVMRSMPNWDELTPDKKQGLTVIADKIARIGTGDPEYTDNYHDIGGYAKLMEDRCRDTQTADMFGKADPSCVNADGYSYAPIDTRPTTEKGYENGN